MLVCVYIYIYACIYVCMYIYNKKNKNTTNNNINNKNNNNNIYIYICVCAYVYVYIYTYIYIYMFFVDMTYLYISTILNVCSKISSTSIAWSPKDLLPVPWLRQLPKYVYIYALSTPSKKKTLLNSPILVERTSGVTVEAGLGVDLHVNGGS